MIKIYFTFKNVDSDLFIKKSLQKFTGSEKNFEIIREKQKKPYINENIYFSLSHSYDLTLCAVSDYKVGIDTEKIRLAANKEAVLKKYFGIEKQMSDLEFFEKWTEFESRVKYFGESVLRPIKAKSSMNTVTFAFEDYVISLCAEDTEKFEMERI